MHSKKFKKTKDYYDSGVWSIDQLRNVVGRWITAEEFEEITGEPYASGAH